MQRGELTARSRGSRPPRHPNPFGFVAGILFKYSLFWTHVMLICAILWGIVQTILCITFAIKMGGSGRWGGVSLDFMMLILAFRGGASDWRVQLNLTSSPPPSGQRVGSERRSRAPM